VFSVQAGKLGSEVRGQRANRAGKLIKLLNLIGQIRGVFFYGGRGHIIKLTVQGKVAPGKTPGRAAEKGGEENGNDGS